MRTAMLVREVQAPSELPVLPITHDGNEAWDEACGRSVALAAEAVQRRAEGVAVDIGWLASATAWVAAVAPDWEGLTGQSPTQRSWRALVDQPELQAWLICWPAGCGLEFHDHGGACGALRVVRGTLEEHAVSYPGGRIRRRFLARGTGCSFGPHFVHAVSNPRQQLVTSVHLYGRASRAPIDYQVGTDGTARPCWSPPDHRENGGERGAAAA